MFVKICLLICDVCKYTLYTRWELGSPMIAQLRQLHMCSTCVLSSSDCCGVIQTCLCKAEVWITSWVTMHSFFMLCLSSTEVVLKPEPNLYSAFTQKIATIKTKWAFHARIRLYSQSNCAIVTKMSNFLSK